LFEVVRIINSVKDNTESVTAEDLVLLQKILNDFAIEILGLKDENIVANNNVADELMNLIIELRQNARTNKDYAVSDKIRDELSKIKIAIKDTKDGVVWNFEN